MPLIACDSGKLIKDRNACAFSKVDLVYFFVLRFLGARRNHSFEYIGFRLPSVTCNCVLPIFFLIQNLQEINGKFSQVFHF